MNREKLAKQSIFFECLFAAKPNESKFTINYAKYEELVACLSVVLEKPIEPTKDTVEGILKLAERFMLLDVVDFVKKVVKRKRWRPNETEVHSNLIPTQCFLERIIRKYIPKELIPSEWNYNTKNRFVANVEKLHNNKLNIYPSIKTLTTHILSFMDYPNTKEDFVNNQIVKTEQIPQIYNCTSGNFWIYKNELFKHFDYQLFFPFYQPDLAEEILLQFWKGLHSEAISEVIVFKNRPEFPILSVKDRKNIFEQYFSVLESRCGDWKKEVRQIDEFLFNNVHLSAILNQKTKPEAAQALIWIIFVTKRVMEFLRINSIELSPNQPITGEMKKIIRVFSYDDNRFSMGCDFLNVLEKTDSNYDKMKSLILEELGKDKILTVDYEILLLEIEVDESSLKTIEFANSPIDLLTFVQTPIPTCNGGYCILAVDAL